MKKILFFCGSLVPGRDGVGDHDRRLAAELMNSGHEIRIVATHDREVDKIVREKQQDKGQEVEVVRIPFSTSSGNRLVELQAQLDDFTPDWLSIQYVPYSFNKRGIPFRFLNSLEKLKGRHHLHFMFHELWLSPDDTNSLKDKIVAMLQRRAVGQIGRRLRPVVVHTHLPAYANRLKKLNLEAYPLPLFSSVDRTASVAPKTDTPFHAIFFSKLIFPPSVVSFLKHLKEDKDDLIVSLLGGRKEKAIKAAEGLRKAIPNLTVDPVGFLSEEELSERLTAADLAISPVPLHLLGKSSTVAAFFSHQLPIAAPRIVEEGEAFFFPELNQTVFSEYSPEGYEQVRTAADNFDTNIISAENISRRFTKDLNEYVQSLAN